MIFMKAKVYSCPMHPEIKKENLGLCPICGMKLELTANRGRYGGDLTTQELTKKLLTAVLLSIPAILLHAFSNKLFNYIPLLAIGVIEMVVSTLAIWWVGLFIMKKGLGSFITFKFNTMTLTAAGVLLAYLYSTFEFLNYFAHSDTSEVLSLRALFFEPSALIMILILAGLLLEEGAKKRIFEEIEKLKDLVPGTGHLVLEKGEERKVALDDLKSGDILNVKPNEHVPADGVVVEGQSWVNEGSITGEHLPIYKRANDIIYQGSLNGNTPLKMSVERVGEETLLARVVQLVFSAANSRTPLEAKVCRTMSIFILLTLLFALSSFLVSLFFGASYYTAVYRAISVLLIASPAALAFSVPLPETAGVILGVSKGILIHQREALEKMDRADRLVIDKSGALTEGRPLLTKIHAQFPFSENEVLRWGASVESSSPHPLGQSYVMGAKLKQIPLMKASSFQTFEGKGVLARVEGSRIAVGNQAFLEELGIESGALSEEAEKLQKEGMTVSFVAMEDKAIGFLAVIDPLRYTAERALNRLKCKGIKVVLATGDSKEAALSIGKRLDLEEIASELLIQDKMALIKRLEKEGHTVAMAGDGENDASAMLLADVGIALGPDVKFKGGQTAVTLMKPELKGIVKLRDLSRKTLEISRLNIGLSIIYNILFVPLASGALYLLLPMQISPFVSCVLMTLCSVAVIWNSLRLRKLALNGDL